MPFSGSDDDSDDSVEQPCEKVAAKAGHGKEIVPSKWLEGYCNFSDELAEKIRERRKDFTLIPQDGSSIDAVCRKFRYQRTKASTKRRPFSTYAIEAYSTQPPTV